MHTFGESDDCRLLNSVNVGSLGQVIFVADGHGECVDNGGGD
jgi:hypothetical protein